MRKLVLLLAAVFTVALAACKVSAPPSQETTAAPTPPPAPTAPAETPAESTAPAAPAGQ